MTNVDDKKSKNRTFDYSQGSWVDSNGKSLKTEEPKRRISMYELGEAYIGLVEKNIEARNNGEDKEYFCEDLLREKFDWVTLRRLKGNITKLHFEFKAAGMVVSPKLRYKSEILKAAEKAKNKPKTVSDLAVKFRDSSAVSIGKSAAAHHERHSSARKEKLERRYAYNTNKLEGLIGKDYKWHEDINEFRNQFSGVYDDGKTEWNCNELAWNHFVQKSGRVTNLQNEGEFWSWVTRAHKALKETQTSIFA